MASRTVLFIGKPGCGKGTQTQLLAAHTGWSVFTAGKMFRDIAQEDSPVGHKVKEENDAGLLQPYWFAMHLYLDALFSLKQDENAIFDGFNRKVREAEVIVDSLRWLGRSFSIVYLAVSDDLVRRRLAGRSAVSGRADDHAVEKRLKEYYAHTERAIEIFRNAGVLIEVDGEQEPDKIASDIRTALKLV